MPRSAAVLALALTLLSFSTAAAFATNGFGPTASLTDLRIGVHPDHTRIVIETDSPAPYVVEPSDKEVVVHVDAAATAEAVTAKSPHLVWVKVEPSAAGSDVKIQLKEPVEVKPLVLTRPDRIVLDLYARKGRAVPAPLPAPEVLPEEEAVTAAREPMAAPEAAVSPEEEPGLPEEAPGPMASGAEAPEGEAPSLGTTGSAPEAEAPAAGAAEKPSFAESGGELAEQGGSAAAPAKPLKPMKPEAPVQQERRPSAPTTPAASTASRKPFLFGATAIVLLVVFVWLRRRLRAAEPRRVSPFPEEEDERAPFEPPERAVAVAEEPATGESVFDVEPDSVQAEAAEVPSLRTPAHPDLEPGDESERRIAHLEKRLEELAEAKDRLERQIGAQTEELRVQRAAIARTQRVLRSIAPKGDDEPSEPLVRG